VGLAACEDGSNTVGKNTYPLAFFFFVHKTLSTIGITLLVL
jgi:hypothetical protein